MRHYLRKGVFCWGTNCASTLRNELLCSKDIGFEAHIWHIFCVVTHSFTSQRICVSLCATSASAWRIPGQFGQFAQSEVFLHLLCQCFGITKQVVLFKRNWVFGIYFKHILCFHVFSHITTYLCFILRKFCTGVTGVWAVLAVYKIKMVSACVVSVLRRYGAGCSVRETFGFGHIVWTLLRFHVFSRNGVFCSHLEIQHSETVCSVQIPVTGHQHSETVCSGHIWSLNSTKQCDMFTSDASPFTNGASTLRNRLLCSKDTGSGAYRLNTFCAFTYFLASEASTLRNALLCSHLTPRHRETMCSVDMALMVP